MDTMYDYNDGMYGVNFIELDKNVKLLERRGGIPADEWQKIYDVYGEKFDLWNGKEGE